MKYFCYTLLAALAPLFSPAEAGIAITSPTTMVIKATPGKTIKNAIALSNTAEKTEGAKIYCSDYFFSADGSCRFESPGSHPKSSCPWIHLSQNTLTLPPKTPAEINYTLNIPDNPSLEGTYWGIIFVEPSSAPTLPSQLEKSYNVKANVRYAVLIIIEIGNTGNYKVKVVKNEVVEKKDKLHIHFDVENQGSRFVQLKPSLDLFTKEGKKVNVLACAPKMVFPTCSTQYSFDVTGVDPGEYLGFLLLDHSEDAIFGGQYPLVIPNNEKPKEKGGNES